MSRTQSQIQKRRHWYTGIVLVPMIAVETMSMLQRHRIGRLVPFFVFLLFGAAFLWLVNAIAPLAPFVYSLF
jgi:hypothetical protein